MNQNRLYEYHKEKVAPLYYYDIGKIKRINKKLWYSLPKDMSALIKGNNRWIYSTLSYKQYGSALRKFAKARLFK